MHCLRVPLRAIVGPDNANEKWRAFRMATQVKKSTRFHVLDVRGAPRNLGRQIGEARRDEVRELVDLVVARVNKGRTEPITATTAGIIAAGAIPFVERYAPDSMEELRGIAQGAGVKVEQVMLLNARNMLSKADDEVGISHNAPTARRAEPGTRSRGEREEQSGGCTSLMVSADASATGGAIAGQNWDNDPAMDPFSLVLIRRPKGKPASMTWTQPGLIAYMGMNDAGIGVCMNALNGPSRRQGVPWYFIVRTFYEQSSLEGVVDAAERAPRTIPANAAMVTPQGAADLEVTPQAVRVLKADRSGRLVHTNHCVHPDLVPHNQHFADRVYGQSVPRKARAETMLMEAGGPVGVDAMKRILSDHDGYPTSICRHPNPDPLTGWQRSVISIILEPSAERMHVSRGNPCEAKYETYTLN